MTLRTLLFVGLLGLGLLPAALLVATTAPTMIDSFRGAATAEAMLRARGEASELNVLLERRKETLRNLALLPAPLEILAADRETGPALQLDVRRAGERFTGVLRRWFAVPEDFRGLAVLDRSGHNLLQVEATSKGVAPSNAPRPFATETPTPFQEAVTAAPGRTAAALVGDGLRLFAPVPFPDGGVAGVLAMEVDLRDALDLTGRTLWVDGQGTYLFQDRAESGPQDAFRRYPALKDPTSPAVLSLEGPTGPIAWIRLDLDDSGTNHLWVGRLVDQSALGDWLDRLRLRLMLAAAVLALAVAVAVHRAVARIDGAKRTMMDGLHRAIDGGEAVRFVWSWPAEMRGLGEELTHLVERHGAALAARDTAEDQLFREKERAQITLQSIADGVLTTDAAGRIGYLNPAAVRLLQRTAEQLDGRAANEVLTLRHEIERTALANPVTVCLDTERRHDVDHDAVLIRPDGVEVAVEVAAAPMHDRDGRVVGTVVAMRDVAHERRLRRMLAHQAAHDPLTGLLNRQAFERRLKDTLNGAGEREEGPVPWLCYVDLDQFKLINDTCGHLAGDELLKQVAQEITRHVGDGDVVSRMGGDEFGVLLYPRGRDAAYALVERIRVAIAGLRFSWLAQSFATSASFGMVAVVPGGGTVYDLLSAADRACYVAKDAGRDRIHLAEGHDAATRKLGGEMEWAHATLRALEEDRFVLYGQAIRPLRPEAGGRHLEILLRMRGSDGAIIPPGAFIPAAERYNLMREVDRWVIRHALAAFALRRELEDVIAVNLSAQSLCDDDFLGFVLAEIDRSAIRSDRLCFEVTETAAMSNLSRAQEVIRALKARGCRFALDDFGSGLSSFGYLRNLSVDYLKIDGSFVRDIAADPLDRAFVRSINDIGHLMGLRTIAEYVETEEIARILADIGVDFAQGYAVARPQPLDALFGVSTLRPSGVTDGVSVAFADS